ncbi:MotA/TolQ/ExbB proton channel family protein [Pelagicoccus sp. SDUM812002]|uniref:MotA/TolQ/ExbB proton channel family protein n=1 Tax=Pelagicoccus sp. SDUM812002 TaxID=3041266 RepID=UPI00280E2574|nr:MotA/TolQ/ExbB proton channel family protein [Pelagicoccus sp. SDUM812002]MDQ8186338.1 MotA/TolQ/ExbB proton channel family protein [Pelagicoccus sp. SDUM812002]
MKVISNFALSATLVAGVTQVLVAQNKYEKAIEEREKRIEEVLADYQVFLTETGDERQALASEINRLESSLVQKRDQRTKAERAAETLELELESTKKRISNLDTQLQYNSGVLSEYLNNFESRLHIAEDQTFREPLFQIRSQLENTSDETNQRIPVFFKALEKGIERQEKLIGGLSFPGRAISPNGGVKTGDILLLGPSAYFHTPENSQTGFLEFNSGTIEPRLALFPPNIATQVEPLFLNGSGFIAIDASQGKANLLKEARGSFLEHLKKGGWVGYAILALGGLSLLIALLKAFDLRSTTVDPSADPKHVAKLSIHSGEEVALKSLTSYKGPIRKILQTGVEFAVADSSLVFEAMETAIIRFRPRLQRFLPFLATTAAIAPLMGLLGTVVGMIKTFTLIEVFGTGDAKSLSSGISEALITTELGLIVAIPALILHGVFSRIMRSRLAAMEEVAEDFNQQLSKEIALASNDQRARA